MKKELIVKCKTCGQNFSYYDSTFRPFCSDRCKMADLGQWLVGNYAIKGEEAQPPTDEEEGEEHED